MVAFILYRDLAAKDANGKSDPYAQVMFQEQQLQTQVPYACQ